MNSEALYAFSSPFHQGVLPLDTQENGEKEQIHQNRFSILEILLYYLFKNIFRLKMSCFFNIFSHPLVLEDNRQK